MKAAKVTARISFKNILYATDFSAASEAALPYVLGFAKHYGAKVHGLHARMPDPGWFMGTYAFNELMATERELARRDSMQLEEMLAGVPHSVTIPEGDIWIPLSELIENQNIDLVIIGTRGRTGVHKAVLGSLAAEIFRSVSCPVLTVGPNALRKPGRELAFSEILYSVDFSAAALAAAPYAISLAQEHQAKLTLLTVLDGPAIDDIILPELLTDSTKRRQRELIPADAELLCKPECVVATGNVTEQILKSAQERKADLIVLGIKDAAGALTSATHLARAIAQEVAAKADCPVLTIRYFAAEQ